MQSKTVVAVLHGATYLKNCIAKAIRLIERPVVTRIFRSFSRLLLLENISRKQKNMLRTKQDSATTQQTKKPTQPTLTKIGFFYLRHYPHWNSWTNNNLTAAANIEIDWAISVGQKQKK